MAKGFSHMRLETQYRSDPEISKFPAMQIRGKGELISHPSTKADNTTCFALSLRTFDGVQNLERTASVWRQDTAET